MTLGPERNTVDPLRSNRFNNIWAVLKSSVFTIKYARLSIMKVLASCGYDKGT